MNGITPLHPPPNFSPSTLGNSPTHPYHVLVFLANQECNPSLCPRLHHSKRCVHLTNYSVNKKSDKFVQAGAGGAAGDGAAAAAASSSSKAGRASMTAGGGGGGGGGGSRHQQHGSGGSTPPDPLSECVGSKWSLSGLRAYLEASGVGPGWAAVWRQVGARLWVGGGEGV